MPNRLAVLVSTEWVAEHLEDPSLRIIEVDVDTTAYNQRHIPGAIGFKIRCVGISRLAKRWQSY